MRCRSWPRSRRLCVLLSALLTHGAPLSPQYALEGDASKLVRGILSSIAAGTFTYVSYMELIGEAFEDRRDRSVPDLFATFCDIGIVPSDRWLKFVVLIIGFTVMALFALFD